MFDDLKPSLPGGNTPNPSPGAINPGTGGPLTPPVMPLEDIFDDMDRPVKPALLQPKAADDTAAVASRDGSAPHSHLAQRIFVMITVIAGIGLASIGGVWTYRYFQGDKAITPAVNPVSNDTNEVTTPVTGETIPAAETPVVTEAPGGNNIKAAAVTPVETTTTPVAVTDSDQDGLTDAEEKALGTDPNNADTDSDGLFDREEVQVYKTDPLNRDTDGDTYLDGAEVKSGYNPNGAGKLYEFNK